MSEAVLALQLCYTKFMVNLFSDTQPEMEALQLELSRQTPAWKKLAMLAQLNETGRMLALSGLRQRYPQASQAELHRRLAGLLLGEELATTVYGDLEHDT
jgi:hypothetical protein